MYTYANIETRDDSLLKQLRWMTVYQRAFYQNCINGIRPSYFKNILTYFHSYSLRSVSQNSVAYSIL